MFGLTEGAAYMPHGYCLFWQPSLVMLHAGSDLLIFLAYSAIPLALVLFLNKRPDIRFASLVSLFAAFIMLCGFTHVVSIATLWEPIYYLHGTVKLLTGVVSAITAITLFVLIPKLVAIPSPQQLRAVHAQLLEEIEAHKKTLSQLQDTEREIEGRIQRTTAELAEANEQLQVSTREAVHRGANLATVILSVARETARRAQSLPDFMDRFSGRVVALATATASLVNRESGSSWRIGDVVSGQLAPMLDTFADQISIAGPDVDIGMDKAQQIALAVHELATNAVKYGALSRPDGRVSIQWIAGADARTVTFSWRETGIVTSSHETGVLPPPVARTAGFGTKLLTLAIPSTLGGMATQNFTADQFTYEIRFPVPDIASSDPAGGAVTPAFSSI